MEFWGDPVMWTTTERIVFFTKSSGVRVVVLFTHTGLSLHPLATYLIKQLILLERKKYDRRGQESKPKATLFSNIPSWQPFYYEANITI